ncbi:hypothetical protein IFR05_016295 [Cadophora sp. M221]|nr:hypothetical protein IFR05_016295 [Cadophora sp. M221]
MSLQLAKSSNLVLGSPANLHQKRRNERDPRIAAVHGPALKEAAERNTKPLPPNTKKLISRESDHKSAGDPKDHITAVAYDADGNRIETIHLDTPTAK